MNGKTSAIWILLGLLLVVGIGSYIYPHLAPRTDDTALVRDLVTAFGAHQKDVSLLAPDAASEIDMAYARYATPELLAAWKASPETAPGRLTSSPWPDHISVESITPAGTGVYTVTGSVVMMTSEEVAHGGTAGTISFTLTVAKQNGELRITAYQQAPSDATTLPPVSGTQSVDAGIQKGASALGIVLLPLAVVEDSRCPTDVQCIQAGTVQVRARVTDAENHSVEGVFSQGIATTTLGTRITLVKVMPDKLSKKTLTPADYLFSFSLSR